MKPRTLAGRMAAVQTIVTLIALGVAVVATAVVITGILHRREDRGLHELAGRVAGLLDGQEVATFGRPWIENEIEELRPGSMRVEIRENAGRLVTEAGPALDLSGSQTGCQSRGDVRVCAIGAGPFLVVAGASEADDLAMRDSFVFAMIIVALLGGMVVTFSSRVVARRALAPLSQLAARIEAIDPGSGQRIGVHCGVVEVDSFAARFDQLLARFEEVLARERRLTAHASHELRTPLTIARAEVEGLATEADGRAANLRALAALDRLSDLVEALLWFARAQVRLDDASMEIVNVADVVRSQVAERERAQPSLVARCELPDEALVRGDERLLSRVIANLLDNATKHGDGGIVAVRAELDAAAVRVSIVNRTGEGTMTERAFEPFFRGPRASGLAGFGLGLPFARAVARAHGGELSIGSAPIEHTEL
ncbi:MAG TPA: HAMP domain-containing sensor histidine kinase, partial [Kofleriaceae bacterium]